VNLRAGSFADYAISVSSVYFMGLFGKKDTQPLPALSERTVKFVKNELATHLWSSAGEKSKNQNPTHVENICKIIDKHSPKKSEKHEGTAHLVIKDDRVLVQMYGMTVDELTNESIATVRDRLSVESPIPVKCRIEIYSRFTDNRRANVGIDHKI